MALSLRDWIYGVVPGLCWTALLLVWSVGAFISIRQKTVRKKPLERLWTSIVVLVCVVLLFLLYIMFLPILNSILSVLRSNWQLLSFDILWLRPLGLLLLFMATIFTLWARIVLGLMWSSIPLIRPDHLLRTNGPYRITRHPIYTGLLGMIIGSLLMLASHQWFVTVIEILLITEVLLILHLKIRLEEHLLLANFGEDYVQFQNRVPQLLPFIK